MLQRKSPPLQALRSFEAVARFGSVSRAAEELCVSQSAVSHQIRHLEEWMAVQLVERSGRGIRLTEAGERYRVKICQAFETIYMETQLLRQREAAPLVRLSSVPGFAVSWLMPQMHEFWEQYPDVQVDVKYSRMSAPLDPATFDLAIHHGKAAAFPEFIVTPLLEGGAVPLASPDYLQRAGYKELGDIARLTLIHDDSREGWRWWLKRAVAKGVKGLSPSLAQSGHVYADGHLVLAACIAGEGVALLTRSIIQFQLRAKFLVQLSDLGANDGSNYVLLVPKSRPLSQAARTLAQWVQSRPGTMKASAPEVG